MKAFIKYMNPAAMKSFLLRMTEEEFMEVAKHIEGEALKLPLGSLRSKYVQLYSWCRNTFPNRFKKQKPSLF